MWYCVARLYKYNTIFTSKYTIVMKKDMKTNVKIYMKMKKKIEGNPMNIKCLPKNTTSLVSIDGCGICSLWNCCNCCCKTFSLSFVHSTGDMEATHFIRIAPSSKYCEFIRSFRPRIVVTSPWGCWTSG